MSEIINTEIKTFEIDNLKTPYRYISVVAKKIGNVPKWHKGFEDDGLGWIFVDEIQINY